MDDKKRGITVKKDENFSEWFTQICAETGAQLVDIRYGIQGFIVHRPWAMRIARSIYRAFEDAVEADGHEPHLFPTVIPKENLEKEEEHAGFTPDVFWVTEAGEHKLESKWALRPTGETQIYPMYALWIRSYNDLPYKGYQSRITTFRHEMTTRPFLRGREFMFFETHDVFAKHDEALAQIKKDMQMMEDVVRNQLKIPFIFFRRPQWDKFMGADDTYASDSLLPDGKRLQISSTHDLGHNFAKAFDIKFQDKDGEMKYGWQTCFGPGIWRIIAALIAVHGDDTGLVLPFAIAPKQIVIVPIYRKDADKEKVIEYCDALKADLSAFRVEIDAREQRPGFKYNYWEMMGVPLRIEVGPKEVEKGTITMARRWAKKEFGIKRGDADSAIAQWAQAHDDALDMRAQEYFADNTKEASTMDELVHIIKTHRGFVKVPFCSIDKDGAVCAEHLKEKTGGANVCGVPLECAEEPLKDAKCVNCGERAHIVVYCAKSV